MAGGEGIAVVQLYALHQRQEHVLMMFKRHYRAVGMEEMFQYLHHHASRQFAQGIEERQPFLLPEQRQQSDDIERPLRKDGVVSEEHIAKARVTGVQHQMELQFRIRI